MIIRYDYDRIEESTTLADLQIGNMQTVKKTNIPP